MPNTTATTTTTTTPAEPTAPPDDAADRTPADEQAQPRKLLPAEHLERNDDMCSSILMDQIACDGLPLGRLGVRHQQAAFERPSIKPAEVLKSIRRVINGGKINDAVREIVEKVPALREHIESKPDKKHRYEATSHIGMYLEVYRPTSRVEIWRTDRYEKAEGYHELGVFATSVIPQGEILYEIQGQCADLPDEWSNSDEEDSDDTSGSDRDKPEDGPARVRRCAIKGRRDFSIISSTRYAKTQLFLGPARFINHDCEPNVELMSLQKNRVSYRTRRRIMIGEELTTIYAPHYFRKNNRGCMCLTCETNGKGYYEKHPTALSMRAAAPSLQEESSSRPTDAVPGSDWDGDSNASDGDSTTEPPTPPSSVDDESIDDSMADSAAVNRPFRLVRNNTRKLDFSKKWKGWSPSDNYLPRRPPVDDPDAKRCYTCIDLLIDDDNPIPREKGWDDYCGRCIRHALIFRRPWPARNKEQVADFPPINLVPINYPPKIISLAVLPSVDPPPEPAPETTVTVLATADNVRNPNKFDRAWWKLKAQWAAEDEEVQKLREADWAQQCMEEERARLAAEHRAEAKRLRELEKEKRNKNKIKGSGLWAKYEEIPEDVMLRRIAERNTVVTGTRSGRRFTAQDDNEADILREAQKALDRERFRDVRDWEKNRRLRIRQQVHGGVEENEEENGNADEGQEVDMMMESTLGEQHVNAVAGPSRGQNAVAGPSRRGGLRATSSASARTSTSPRATTRATPAASARAPSRSLATPRGGPPRTPQTSSSARARLLQNGTKDSPYEIQTSSDDDLRPRRPAGDKFSDNRFIIDLAGSSSSEDDGLRRLSKPLKYIPNPRYSTTRRAQEEHPDAPPVKRGPGRPRGTGPKQIRERRRAERERARLEKEKEKEKEAAANAERRASSSRKQSADGSGAALSSADEASPPSIRSDEPDSDTHMSLDEDVLFAGPAEFTSSPSESESSESSLSPSPPPSMKRKRPSGSDGPGRPRHFFKFDGIPLARVSPDRSRPPPAVFTGPT